MFSMIRATALIFYLSSTYASVCGSMMYSNNPTKDMNSLLTTGQNCGQAYYGSNTGLPQIGTYPGGGYCGSSDAGSSSMGGMNNTSPCVASSNTGYYAQNGSSQFYSGGGQECELVASISCPSKSNKPGIPGQSQNGSSSYYTSNNGVSQTGCDCNTQGFSGGSSMGFYPGGYPQGNGACECSQFGKPGQGGLGMTSGIMQKPGQMCQPGGGSLGYLPDCSSPSLVSPPVNTAYFGTTEMPVAPGFTINPSSCGTSNSYCTTTIQ